MTVELHPPTGGVQLVSSERCTIKCSNMKSGVFPCALQSSLHGPKYGTVQLSTTHKVRSLTDPTEGVANSYSRLNRPIMYVPITVLKAL